jgi:hypothetical protein
MFEVASNLISQAYGLISKALTSAFNPVQAQK